MGKRILVDLGGNAIKQAGEKGTPEERIDKAIETIEKAVKEGST